jgi:hypothetical protein
MSVVNFGSVPCGCSECAVGAPASTPTSVGAPHGGGHHLPPALKAHEFKNKPGANCSAKPTQLAQTGPNWPLHFLPRHPFALRWVTWRAVQSHNPPPLPSPTRHGSAFDCGAARFDC